MEERRNLFGCLTTAVVVAIIGIGAFWLYAYRSVDAGEVALRFGGGALDAKNGKFKAVHGPGRHNMGLADRVYAYPDTVQNYVFAPEDQERDAAPVPCVTKSTDKSIATGPKVDMTGQFLFHLNTVAGERAPLGVFHAKYVRFHAWEDAGWTTMANQLFKPAAESAIVAACRNFTVDDLSRQDKIDEFQRSVGETVTKSVHVRMGGQFFCGSNFDRITQPNCSPEVSPVVFEMKPVLPPTQLTDAATRFQAAQRNLAAAKIEAQAIEVARKQGLSGMAWVASECLKIPSCRDNMTFVAGDAGVTVGGK